MKFLKKSVFISALMIFTLLLSACANPLSVNSSKDFYSYEGSSYELSDVSGSSVAMSMPDGEYGFDGGSYDYDDSTDTGSVDQKIIKSGSLDIHVDDVRESVDAIEEAVVGWGGSVLYLNLSKGSSSYYADIQIRVPAEGFDSAMESLKDLSVYVSNEWTSADDVTDAYMDLTARVNNAYAEEQAYLDLMDRAGTISEILEVTRALADVRSDIEYMESQLSYYDTRVAYSTIDLYVTEDESVSAVTEQWRPFSTVTDAFGDWLVFLQDITDGVIYLVIFAWPFALIGWFVWRKFGRKKRK